MTVVSGLVIVAGLVVLAVGQIRTSRKLAALEEAPPGAPAGLGGLAANGGLGPGGAMVAEDDAPNAEITLPTGMEVPAEFRALVGEDLPDVAYRVGDVEIVAAIVRMEGTDLALGHESLTAGLEIFEKHMGQRFVPGEAKARLGIESALMELLDDPQREYLYKNLAVIKTENVQPEVVLEQLRVAAAGRG